MSIQTFIEHAPDWAPVRMNPSYEMFKSWKTGDGYHYAGTVDIDDGKADGIVRRHYPGEDLLEYQAKDGKPHGFYRQIWWHGEVEFGLMRNGHKECTQRILLD
jgi:hypothetical protein